MLLNNSITINLNSGEQLVLDNLDVVIFDHESRKLVLAKIHPLASILPLWRGKEYDDVGDYTQMQVNDRIKELLGPDMAGMQNLFNIEVA